MLHVFVACILANKIIEVIPVEKCYQLSENVLVLIHMQTILAAKIQKSSPLTQKISLTNYISIISKNALRFLVDSNDCVILLNSINLQMKSLDTVNRKEN